MAENLDPNAMYLEWSGSSFPNSSSATFKAPAGSTIDWGDGTVETFDTDSPQVNTHTYNDEVDNHLIKISGVTSIGNNAFLFCNNLTRVVIPNSVTSIGSGAFLGNKLVSIEVSTDNTAYQSIDGNLYTKDGTMLLQYPIGKTATSFIIPDSVTEIGRDAFNGCSSLTSVTIPDGVTSIGWSAFSSCRGLTSVEIPNSVTLIGNSAFFGCRGLTSFNIPNRVTSIGRCALQDCSGLKSVLIGDSVTSIGYDAFSRCSSLTSVIVFPATPPKLDASFPSTIQSIYVQKSSAKAYKTATNWSSFADKIVGNTTYLSFVRFNQANKKYIDAKIVALENRKVSASQLDIATQDDVLELLLKSGSVSMAYASESKLYTDEVGKIYIL